MLDISKMVSETQQKLRDEISEYIKQNPGELDDLVDTTIKHMDPAVTASPDVVTYVDAMQAAVYLMETLSDLSGETADVNFGQKAALIQNAITDLTLKATAYSGRS